MASLYSNENFPKRVVEELRRLGHDVLTSYEAGRANQTIPDDQVLAYASELNRVVLTLNRFDFIRLHQETQGAHAGIIVCTRDDAGRGSGSSWEQCDGGSIREESAEAILIPWSHREDKWYVATDPVHPGNKDTAAPKAPPAPSCASPNPTSRPCWRRCIGDLESLNVTMRGLVPLRRRPKQAGEPARAQARLTASADR